MPEWLCGFANADDVDVLVIGRDDKGTPIGVPNAKKLLEDLPNKTRDVLGIMADVRLVKKSGKELVQIHVDYGSAIPIQISVYDDHIVFWNPGILPETWTLKKLLGKHHSQPFNPLIAGAFFRAGYIEAWGRGIEKIEHECRAWH